MPGRYRLEGYHRRAVIHGHGHDHAPGAGAGTFPSAAARHRGSLTAALALVGAYFFVEVVAAVLTGSLALLGDAGHTLTDAVGLGMALAAAAVAASGSANPQRSFGLYRLEILAALANAGLLFGVVGYVLYESVARLVDPPEVLGGPMIVVAAVGLLLNVVAVLLLRRGASESLNLEGAYLEVLADAFGSVGVIVAGTVQLTTGWPYADPLVAIGVAALIAPRAWRLGARALRILLQAAPAHLPVERLRADLSALEGVVDVHDLHVWTLTSDMEVVSAHVMVHHDADTHATLDQARALLSEQYGIEHATLQVEPDTHEGCEHVEW